MQGQHSYNKRSSEDRLFESICSRRQRVRLNRPFGPENAPQAVSGMLIRTSQERRESPPLIPQSPELDDLPKTIFGHVIAFIGMARRSVDVYWFSSEHWLYIGLNRNKKCKTTIFKQSYPSKLSVEDGTRCPLVLPCSLSVWVSFNRNWGCIFCMACRHPTPGARLCLPKW